MDGHEHGGAENEREEQRFRRWNRKAVLAYAAHEPGPYSADACECILHVSDLPCVNGGAIMYLEGGSTA